MDAIRLGAVFRAVRLRKRWRQLDVASRANVSQPTVSRLERGQLAGVSVGALSRVAGSLEVMIDWAPRWRGGDLDRMLNARHAAMHGALARLFRGSAWMLQPEATFSIYGERGSIDVLAFHPAARALLVIELKTQIVDIHDVLASTDRYRRLAPRVAAERGWRPRTVSCWLLVRDTATNRRRVAANASVLRVRFPADGRAMKHWVRQPGEPIHALSFLSDGASASADGAPRRVRRAS